MAALPLRANDAGPAPIVFRQTGDFAAVHAAVTALCRAGFAVGQMQAHAPRGLLLRSDVVIMKWRNLSSRQRLDLDGEMHGGRDGPVTIVPSSSASAEVLRAFDLVRPFADVEPIRLTKLVGGFAVDA